MSPGWQAGTTAGSRRCVAIPLQIEFLGNLLEGLRAELWVCQSPGRWRIV
jgi:hypothetical protein